MHLGLQRVVWNSRTPGHTWDLHSDRLPVDRPVHTHRPEDFRWRDPDDHGVRVVLHDLVFARVGIRLNRDGDCGYTRLRLVSSREFEPLKVRLEAAFDFEQLLPRFSIMESFQSLGTRSQGRRHLPDSSPVSPTVGSR